MDIQDLKDHIDSRLDRIEDKIDGHADRIAKSETDLTWVKGSIKTSITLLITVAGALMSWLLTSGRIN